MRVYLMTDLEGVAGVRDATEWLRPGDEFYELGCDLLTGEVNAAIAGLMSAGATEVAVADGHGAGAINVSALDSRAEYIRVTGPQPYPFQLDCEYDAIGWVGQHAKAGTKYAHLPHTGSFNIIDYRINGESVGEFMQIALCAQQYGTVPLFAIGDQAFAREARHAIPTIHALSVKRGLSSGEGDEKLDASAYRLANARAAHMKPSDAQMKIREATYYALKNFQYSPSRSLLPSPLTREIRYRQLDGVRDVTIRAEYPDLLSLLNDLPE